MGNKVHRRLDNKGGFLGSTDKKYGNYLRYYYENDIEGDSDQKFESFKELIEAHEDI